jgi:hypothetical protein
MLFSNINMNDNGEYIEKIVDNPEQVSMNLKISGLSWNITEVVSTESNDTSSDPSMAVDGAGNIHVVWADWTDYNGSGTDRDIFYKCWNASTGNWTTTEVVSTESTGFSRDPSIAADGIGNVHVAWDDGDIFYKRWNATTSNWTTTEVVSTESTGGSGSPSIAVDGAGNVHVAWDDNTDYNGSGTDDDIFYKRWNTTTSNWTTTEVVSTESSGNSWFPSIAVNGTEIVHIAWRDPTDYGGSGTDDDIFYKRWNATSDTWTTTEVVSTESFWHSYGPSISVDGAGNAHVAWSDGTGYMGSGNDYDIFYKHWNATSDTWTTTEVVSTESTGASQYPSIAVDGAGNVYVAWIDYTDYNGSGTDGDIFYKLWNATIGTWTMTEVVSTESINGSGGSSIAMDGAANVHVVWHDLTDYGGSGTDQDICYSNQIPNDEPYSNQPTNIITTALGIETINWTLFDNNSVGGRYRIRADDTNNNYYVWIDWTTWSNSTPIYVTINRSASGIFSYIIDYHDAYYMYGAPDEVIVTITNDVPTSSSPSDILTSAQGSETINWTLYDGFGGGQYRVLANDTNNKFYIWVDWTAWSNNTPFNIPINRSAPGIFNYTIEFNDTDGVFGNPDTVLVNITDAIPYSNSPIDILTSKFGSETINWMLYDDFGGGQYRVLANDTNNNFYIWKNWTSWTNDTSLNIPINRTALGTYNYTIEYNDIFMLSGIVDTVIVDFLDAPPEANSPENIIVNKDDVRSIQWFLTDDWGPGNYRILVNGIPGNWASWTNNTPIIYDVSTSAAGAFNITIEFFDSMGNTGYDTVFVTVIGSTNGVGDEILFILIITIILIASAASIGFTVFRKRTKQKFLEQQLELRKKDLQIKYLKTTEEDIKISKEQHFCLVHKGTIKGYTFICPTCGAFYCSKCLEAIKEIENACWSCRAPFDPTKPEKALKKDEKIGISDEDVEKRDIKHKKS